MNSRADRHAAPTHLVGSFQCGLLPCDADDPRPQDRNQLVVADAVRWVTQERPGGVRLPLLHVEQEHIRRIGRHLH